MTLSDERLKLLDKIQKLRADKQRYASAVLFDGRELNVMAEALLDRAIEDERELLSCANLQNAWAAIRMIREAVEEFGPIASLESEDANLLRGPEPVHAAEAIVEALSRVRAAFASAPIPMGNVRRDECATDGCHRAATEYFESGGIGPGGGIGSAYCHNCASLVKSIALKSDAAATLTSLLERAERAEARINTLEARVSELDHGLRNDLNVTDEELLRIRNRAERNADGEVKIWGKMLLKLIDAVRRARAASVGE